MDLIQKFNPANAENLTTDDIAEMKNLSGEEIALLAGTYPNTPMGNAYLRLYNSKENIEAQRFPLSTWQNLHNLRKLNQNHFSAAGFSKGFLVPKVKNVAATSTRTLDLGNDENLEGLKSGTENVEDPAKQPWEGEGKIIPPADLTLGAQAVNDNISKKEPSALQLSYDEALAELNEAKDNLAHHMTIKSLETKVAAAKQALDEEGK